ncbi:unnamed protein product, partial [Enterobius vermicularis]|uniref:Costars domain-containing protein n=1 Tax=Enterobius vermicularis TaxID=51028 RepID=A0A0N4VN71_ENTVE
ATDSRDIHFRNPFSETYSIQHFDTKTPDYGRPPKGSKTEARGIKAGVHVMREVLFLMETINDYALVGMLIRARKYGLVDFDGEMLYQRQDDDKIIKMLKPIIEIRTMVQSSNDPVNCISIAK